MRYCSRCKTILELKHFSKNSRYADGVALYCKFCYKNMNAKRYKENKEAFRQRNKTRDSTVKEQSRLYVWNYLLSHPCVDCGESDPIVLDFDHIETNKIKSISNLIGDGHSLHNIIIEIAKCEVRCANCHRRITAARGGFWKHRFADVADREAASSNLVI
jgi:DNA-directed RNA polymerase subunit M/transcription elongation factor TFIIS